MVTVHNKQIGYFLETYFGKRLSEIDPKELEEVDVIGIEGNQQSDNYEIDLEDLPLFPNLKGINIAGAFITPEDLRRLSFIKQLHLNRCALQNDFALEALTNLEELELKNSFVESYDALSSLANVRRLVILNPQQNNTVDCTRIGRMPHLKELTLEKCNVMNFEQLSSCGELEWMNLLGSTLPENYEAVLNSLPALKDLFISKQYADLELEDVLVRTDLSEFMFDDDPLETEPQKTV